MAEEVAEGAGAEDISVGDFAQYIRILVDDLNARGGLAGRQVTPVVHEIDYAAAGGLAAEFEGACATFTQDQPVFAVVTQAQAPEPLRGCLEQAGVLAVLHGLTTSDQEVLERHPHLIELTLRLDRVARALADTITSSETEGRRVGIVTYDGPAFQRATAQLEEQLAAAGMDMAESAAVTEPQSPADFGAVSGEVGGAVLRFKDAGVTDVVFVEQGGLAPLFFLQAAEQQGFQPDYLLTTHDGGQALVPSLPPTQLEGARLVGWSPLVDVGQSAAPQNPAATRCRDVLAAEGIHFPDANAETIALGACDGLWLLEAALDGLDDSPSLTASAAVAAIEGLGDSYESTTTFETRFGPGQHDGVAAYRIAEFNVECTCFEYVTDSRPIPE